MDPILTEKLLGIPYAGAGTNLERSALMGIMREMIKANKYTAEYILDYCQSVGYPYKMASDIFTEMTGINPKVIINNNEYYQNPVFVPSMTLGWGYKKGTKTEAYYVVPFEYGYSVMYKNENDSPESKFEYITINDAVNKLKTLVTKVFTINKIINENCLKYEDIQLNANSVHQTNNVYFSSPINEMKQSYINKAIDDSEFEKRAFRLVAEDKITTKEAEDAMKWLDKKKDEDDDNVDDALEFNNRRNDKKMEKQEESKQLSGSIQFDEIVEELYTTIGDEYADKNKLREIYLKNKLFFSDLNKEDAAQKLYELYLGFTPDEINKKNELNKNASLKKSAADADIELDDIKEKDILQDRIDKINDTDFNDLVKEETPQQYLENESSNEQVNQINEKVNKIIDEFTSKFDDFTKYKLQLSSYKLQILNQGIDNNGLKPIEDVELNAQAILQIIITIAPTEDLDNSKKGLAIFSINKEKVLFNGVIRDEDGFVAFSEEGFDTIFTDDDEQNITEDLI